MIKKLSNGYRIISGITECPDHPLLYADNYHSVSATAGKNYGTANRQNN